MANRVGTMTATVKIRMGALARVLLSMLRIDFESVLFILGTTLVLLAVSKLLDGRWSMLAAGVLCWAVLAIHFRRRSTK